MKSTFAQWTGVSTHRRLVYVIILLLLVLVVPASVRAVGPADGVELTQRRTRDAKHFTMPSGGQVAAIGAAPLHYRDASGLWQDIDVAFHSDPAGDDLADHNAFVVRADIWGLTLTDWWGRGILWLMPSQ